MSPSPLPDWRAVQADLLRLTPQQPATVSFRTVEMMALAQMPQLLPKGHGLDLGCGDGTIVHILRSHVDSLDWTLTGLDPDPLEIELAQRSGEYHELVEAGGESMPFDDARFDFAFSNSVLEHVPDLPSTLAEAARVIRPGGLLVATVPSDGLDPMLRGPGLLRPLLGWRRADYERRFDRRNAHLNLWSTARWDKELRSAGFSSVEFHGYLDIDDTRRWERLGNWSSGLLLALLDRNAQPIDLTRRFGATTYSKRLDRFTPLVAAALRATFAAYSPSPPELVESTAGYGCLLVHATK